MRLEFGDDLAGGRLALPDEPSEKLAIVGVSGSGKSYLAGRLAEEWMVAGRRVAVLDPVGVWFGLRTGADGDPDAGLPVRVYGGQRMDEQLPQPREAAERIALAQDWCAVYDLSAVPFETVHWWTAALLNHIGELGPRIQVPLHLILEEAPVFAPQTGSLSRFQRDCKAAVAQCARVYRNFGVGMTVITQRAAAVSKDVFTQCGTMLAMRVAAKLDRRALMDWCASNAPGIDLDKELEKLSVASAGHGVVWSPTWAPDVSGNCFRTLARSTYHPDPRRLAENRAVRLRTVQPGPPVRNCESLAEKLRRGAVRFLGLAQGSATV